MTQLMCQGPTVQQSAGFLEVTRLFYARLLYTNMTTCSELSKETDYRLKVKLSAVVNKFSLHME